VVLHAPRVAHSGRTRFGREGPVNSRIVHFQLGAVDADVLASFYRDVFGWNVLDARLTSEEADLSGPYRSISSDAAGLSGGVTAEGPKGVVLSVEVDDIAETLDRAERLGGRPLADVEAERLRLDGAGSADGTFAVHTFVDPEGNPVQIIQR
jgi:predicted enzyme related to lactoylglutathione lyase